MKKSFIAASLLFSISAFAVCDGSRSFSYPSANEVVNDQCNYFKYYAPYYEQNGNYCLYIRYDEKTNTGSSCSYDRKYFYSIPEGSICPSNTTRLSSGVCAPTCTNGGTFNVATNVCSAPILSAFNNNPSGCASAGGYYFNDGKCVDGTDAIAKVFTDPTAIVGGLIFINGAAWSIAGAYALPITGGASGAAIAYGGHAMVAGLATLGVSALGQLYNQPDSVTPKSDSTTGETRIKVKLQSDNSTTVAQGDISSGKVESISYIPPEVKQRILEGVVNPTTGLPNITQSDLAGTTVTKYNYSTNTATTETIKTDGTTVTSTTPITPISNPDGTVTAQSHNEAVAPTVTGTKSSTWAAVPEWNQYQTIAQWTETIKTNSGTGSTSGGGTTGTIPVNTGDATADAIVNAKMPTYSIPDIPSIGQIDSNPIEDMYQTASEFNNNVIDGLSTSHQMFEDTKSILEGGWQPPQIPAGECGTSLSMDFHGTHVDLCPTITQFTSQYSPVFSLLTSIALIVVSISIFLGGF